MGVKIFFLSTLRIAREELVESEGRGQHEIRVDWFTGRTCVIAKGRAARPMLFKREIERERAQCPFCPGNENMTPPAQLVLKVIEEREIMQLYGPEASAARDWQVRAFPNMYPAFRAVPILLGGKTEVAYGYHMILVDSPSDDRDTDSFTDAEIRAYLMGLNLMKELLEKDERISYTSIFKNYGKEAGASIPHPHTQLIASEIIPELIKRELEANNRVKEEEGRQAISKLIDEAEEEGRLIFSGYGFASFVPFAPISPYEFWIGPLDEDLGFPEAVDEFGRILRSMFRSMKSLLGEAPYNFYLHLPPRGCQGYQWHLECVPRVNTFGGYELGFQIFIITQAPEEVAKLYKQQMSSFDL